MNTADYLSTQTHSSADGQPALLGAAEREFRAHGFKNASVRRIASNAGYAVGTIYFYFGSKEGLFRAVVAPIEKKLHHLLQELGQQDFDIIATSTTLEEASTREVQLMTRMVRYLIDNREDITLINQETGAKSRPIFNERLRQWLDASVQLDHPPIDKISPSNLEQILLLQETLNSAFVEFVRRVTSGEYDEETALEQAAILTRFLTVGWNDLLDLFPSTPTKEGKASPLSASHSCQ